MQRIGLWLAGVGLSLGMATPSAASDAVRLAEALTLQESGRISQASAAAARANDPLVPVLVLWERLSRGDGSWGEMARHLDRYRDWPRTSRIRRHAERAMPVGLDPAWVVSFFAGGALTGTGALRHAAALRALEQEGEAESVLRRAWTSLSMRREEREAFQAAAPAMARQLAPSRLETMLWAGETDQAEALLPLVEPGRRQLAAARIGLQTRRNGVDALIAAVPRSLADDPGLAHDRFVWRLRSDLDASAVALLLERSQTAASLGRPEAWARRRAGQVRRLLRAGLTDDAYLIARQHHLDAGAAFADLEWLAGWIALRHLDQPAEAVVHFERVWAAVGTPISLGRAAYWMGRALEAQGMTAAANGWYERAAAHATSFYGQLAAERIGLDLVPALTARRTAPSPALLDQTMVQATRLLDEADEPGDTYAFLLALARLQQSAEGFAAAGELALSLDRPEAAVRIGKMAARAGHIVMDLYYPLIALPDDVSSVDPALALAIARQESEFNPRAVSPAGARGLMQLMPATAQRVARDLGVAHSRSRLTEDPAHNVRLGKAYLASRLERYDGAVILAAASYNAGASRVDEWIERFGDPRRGSVDAIDWIEMIPFSETRNYVQRVMEGLHVYRARLGGASRDYAAALVQPQG